MLQGLGDRTGVTDRSKDPGYRTVTLNRPDAKVEQANDLVAEDSVSGYVDRISHRRLMWQRIIFDMLM